MAKKSKSKRSISSPSVPRGVKIISVLMYVISVFLLLSSVAFFFSAATFDSSSDAQAIAMKFFEEFTASTTVSVKILEIVSYLLIGAGIVALLFTVLFFYVARGLWNGKRWARIVAVVFFALGFIGALADILRGDIVGNIPQLIVDGIIAGYLLFNSKVQAAFSN